MTIRMIRTEDGKTADIHPNEVEHMKGQGWEAAEDQGEGSKAEISTGSGDQFSDEQLRAIITEASGKAPHPQTGRVKLIAKFNELNAKPAE